MLPGLSGFSALFRIRECRNGGSVSSNQRSRSPLKVCVGRSRVSVPARAGRCAAGLIAASILVVPQFSFGQGALRNWSIINETSLGSGHDSNIYGSRFLESEDEFGTASHSILVSRRNSLTELDIAGSISETRYFSQREADYTEGSFEFSAAYPKDTLDSTHWKAGGYYSENMQVNLDVGRRIQPTIYGASFTGDYFISPKSGIIGSVRARKADRTDDGLSNTESISFRTGFSHAWRPERRWNFEYGLELGETDAGRGTDSVHQTIGVRKRGRISPKLTGDAYFGIRSSEFEGVQNFDDDGPTASADIVWHASPLLTVKLGFNSDYDFSANGLAVLNTGGKFELTKQFGKGLRFSTTIEKGYVDYEGGGFFSQDRSDEFWILGGVLEYSFTRRFFARLTADFIDSESNLAGNEVSRGFVFFQSGLRY